MKILIADPAKNITAFVLDPVADPARRTAISRAILADKGLAVEQVGFVFPPTEENDGDRGLNSLGWEQGSRHNRGFWRLEMAGGEFCGNAARSFGLYVAGITGVKGKARVLISISGSAEPVPVDVDTERCQAQAEMPLPLEESMLDYGGRALPVFVFEGIAHVIAPDIKPEPDAFSAIKLLTVSKYKEIPAFGVMFYETASAFMRPAVYVRDPETLVFESSCGSGSAALGIWLGRGVQDGTTLFRIAQPGGVIETAVAKKSGSLVRVAIGGPVMLGAPEDRVFR